MREANLQNMVLKLQGMIKQENELLLHGQPHILSNLQFQKNILYEQIEQEYKLDDRIKTWGDSYSGFFDEYDDFYVLCRGVFYEAISKWKSLQQRVKENFAKYDAGEIELKDVQPKGNGEINTFFAYCLRHRLINHYKNTLSPIRNPQVKCPICSKMVSPFKVHLKEDHQEYLKTAMTKYWNRDINSFKKCPVCKDVVKDMMAHITSRHPNHVYELFHNDYPNFILTEKPNSLDYEYFNDEGSTTLGETIKGEGEEGIVDEINYQTLLAKAFTVLNQEENTLFALTIEGYTRKEICAITKWDFSKYSKVRIKLRKNTKLREIWQVQSV